MDPRVDGMHCDHCEYFLKYNILVIICVCEPELDLRLANKKTVL